MFQPTKMTTLLLLVTCSMAWEWPSTYPPWSNNCGPATRADRHAGIAGATGEPRQGYHIATRDASKSWNALVTCKDGTQRQNQYIAKDAEPNTAAINIDPADGVWGTGTYPWRTHTQNYVFDNHLWVIPDGYPNAGYPVKPLADSYVSVLQAAGADLKGTNGSSDGLMLTRNLQATNGYNKVAEDNDYMLLVFCAKWCAACEDFRPRFEQYYNKIKQTSTKFEAVYFSNDNTAEEFRSDNYGCPEAPFDQELADRLERTLGKNQIPCVIVVNRNGGTLTTDGVRAIKGLSYTGTFPAELGSGAEFFADEPILPNRGKCFVDADAQRVEIKKLCDAEVAAMNYDMLAAEANKLALGGAIPSDKGPLREFVKQKLVGAVDMSSDANIHDFYAASQEAASHPSQYKFAVDDHVRVKTAFSSDPEQPGSSASQIPALDDQGRRNLEASKGAAGVEGAIEVQFNDNLSARRWILPEHFENIEQIP